ncbi:zinc finger protein [Macleaya cordata]|uniref:Protein FAR1-RELATED SEQUENCE n=1 Tax=Macleaya cordata TaxID=56857 RepID=A0A200R8Z6_MACCD|nr:zinc finger protein [Macleaya cordata]
MVIVYDIRENVVVGEGTKKNLIFTVSFKRPEYEVECSCHMFEFRGILCRHAIYVLRQNDVELLPDKYILSRWRKDVRRSHTRVKLKFDGWIATAEEKQYDQMCVELIEITDLASLDEEDYHEVREWVAYQKKKLTIKRSRVGSNNTTPKSNAPMNSQNIIDCGGDASKNLPLDPEATKRKGRPRGGRLQSELEKRLKKNKNKGTSRGDGQIHKKRSKKNKNNGTPSGDGQDSAPQCWNASYDMNAMPCDFETVIQHPVQGYSTQPAPNDTLGLRLFGVDINKC